MATITHQFVDPTTDWTQTDVDAAITRGELPAGTLAANMTKPSHWNADHTLTGTIPAANLEAADSTGQLQFNNAGAFGGAAFSTVSTSGTHLRLTAQAATDIPLAVRGAASQTANLQQWQDSAGTVMASASAAGIFSSYSLRIGTGATNVSPWAFAYDVNTFTTPASAGRGLSIYSYQNAASSTAVSFAGDASIQTSGTNAHVQITRSFSPTSGTASYEFLRVVSTVNQTGGANGIVRGVYVNPTLTAAADWRSIETTNNTGFAIYAGGTAPSLFNGNTTITNITGNPSLTVQNGGNTAATAALMVGTTLVGFHVSGINYDARVIASGAARIPFTIRGAASHSANLLEIQNSAASVIASFDASGNLTVVGSGTTNVVCSGIRRRAGNTNFLVGGGGSTATGTYSSITLSPITDGAWTQTSGTLSAVSITPSYNQASGTASNTDLLINRTETALGSGQQNFIDMQVGGVSRMRVTNLGSCIQVIGSAATIGAIVRGAASQTANLQEWQDSAGTALASMSSTGVSTVLSCRTNLIQRNSGNQPIVLYNAGISTAGIFALNMGGTNFTNSSGVVGNFNIATTYNQTATAGSTDLQINRTETALGSGQQNFIDMQVGGTSLARIDNTGVYHGGINSIAANISAGTNVTFSGAGTIASPYVINASGGGGSFTTYTVNTFSTSTTLTSAEQYVRGNAAGGAITITLPTAVGITGKFYIIKKVDLSANNVTVACTGGQTIEGAAIINLTSYTQCIKVVSNNANWEVESAY